VEVMECMNDGDGTKEQKLDSTTAVARHVLQVAQIVQPRHYICAL